MVKLWLFLNGLFIASVFYFSWNEESVSAIISSSKGIAQISLIFFLLNINMFFILLIVRESKNRNVKKGLAKLARKAMKFHIPIAITGSALVITHIVIMLLHYPMPLTNFKMVSGFFAFLMLLILLLTGYRRHKKATGLRRKSHIFMAFLFFLFASLHIFI